MSGSPHEHEPHAASEQHTSGNKAEASGRLSATELARATERAMLGGGGGGGGLAVRNRRAMSSSVDLLNEVGPDPDNASSSSAATRNSAAANRLGLAVSMRRRSNSSAACGSEAQLLAGMEKDVNLTKAQTRVTAAESEVRLIVHVCVREAWPWI